MPDELHPSHVTRFSDASSYDEKCVNCGATDEVPGGWGALAKPCRKPVGSGGLTYDEWIVEDRKRQAAMIATLQSAENMEE